MIDARAWALTAIAVVLLVGVVVYGVLRLYA